MSIKDLYNINVLSIGIKEIHITDYSVINGWTLLNNAYRENIEYVVIHYRLKNGTITNCKLYYGCHDFSDSSNSDLIISNSALPYFDCTNESIVDIILGYSIYERLTWNEIQRKYPDMYVGLTNIEYTLDGKIKSAEVKYSDKFGKDLNILTVRNNKLIGIHTKTNELLGGRLSVDEVKTKYPNKWLGIRNFDTTSNTVYPKYFNMTKEELIEIQIGTKGEIICIYTTPSYI